MLLRHRTQTDDPAVYVPFFEVNQGKEMYDDPTFATRYSFKECTYTHTKILTDQPQVFKYYWFNYWDGNWYGPVTYVDGEKSSEGPNGFHAQLSPGDPDYPDDISPGFIWDEIKKYGKSDLNLGVFLGELRETVQMFHKPWKFANGLRNGKVPKWVKTIPDALKFASDTYLGYRYGLRPFLSDVRAVTKLSKRLNEASSNDDSSPRTLKAYRTRSFGSSRSGMDEQSGPAHMVKWANNRTITDTKCEFVQVVNNPSPDARGLASRFADFYHLDDVASIAWELLPYSFIVDWFCPIGDSIAAATDSPANLVTVSSPWQWTRRVDRVKISNYGYSDEQYRVELQFGYTVESKSFSRSPLGSIPPKPVDIDGYQTADLALIAGQRLGSLFGKSFR